MYLCCSSPLFATAAATPSCVLRSTDQLLDVMTLACELLPSGQDLGTSAAARDPAASLSEATISSPGMPFGAELLAWVMQGCHGRVVCRLTGLLSALGEALYFRF